MPMERNSLLYLGVWAFEGTAERTRIEKQRSREIFIGSEVVVRKRFQPGIIVFSRIRTGYCKVSISNGIEYITLCQRQGDFLTQLYTFSRWKRIQEIIRSAGVVSDAFGDKMPGEKLLLPASPANEVTHPQLSYLP
jgi:hypothetical protein